MVKKITIIISVTIVAAAAAAAEFFFMGGIPKFFSMLLHNTLASLVGIGFIYVSESLQKIVGRRENDSLFFLTIGIVMLTIHLITIFLKMST